MKKLSLLIVFVAIFVFAFAGVALAALYENETFTSTVEPNSYDEFDTCTFTRETLSTDTYGMVYDGKYGVMGENNTFSNLGRGIKIGSGDQSTYNIFQDTIFDNVYSPIFIANATNTHFWGVDINAPAHPDSSVKNHAIYVERGNSGVSLMEVKIRGSYRGYGIHAYYTGTGTGTNNLSMHYLDIISTNRSPILISQNFDNVSIAIVGRAWKDEYFQPKGTFEGPDDYPLIYVYGDVNNLTIQSFDVDGPDEGNGACFVGIKSGKTVTNLTIKNGNFNGDPEDLVVGNVTNLTVENVSYYNVYP